MAIGLLIFCFAVMLAVSGGRGAYRDFKERSWAWAVLGAIVTVVGTLALVALTFIAGADASGGP